MFAAEFLAASELLAERIGKRTILREDDVTTLAAEFSARPIVIRHQIQNHSLANVVDD